MASEIKVDTISEKTSAGGVTIDGLLIKDGGISGDVSLIGTTPTFTIGDAGAEDATLLFDGNAQDFHIGLDDTADDLVIGVGSTLGTTTAIAIDENANTTFSGTVTVGVDDTGKDVKFFGATASRYWLWDESADGVVQRGTLTVGVDDTGHDVKLFGATAGSFLLWDESADSLLLTDSTPIKIGDAQDLTLYHDGTNSYITNAVGALKVATETSGIAVTIGHTTSETTVADNLTVTGTATITGGQIVFPATQVSTTNANTLDDYEEGTWTPVYASTGATITNGSTTGGAYRKIGSLVTVQGSTSTGGAMSGGTAGNPVRIEGLPFTVDDDTSGENMRPTGCFDTWNSSYQWAEDGDQPSVVSAVNNQTYLYLSYRDAVDKYRIDTRFDDLQDSSSNPRNLAYFSITYIAAT